MTRPQNDLEYTYTITENYPTAVFRYTVTLCNNKFGEVGEKEVASCWGARRWARRTAKKEKKWRAKKPWIREKRSFNA